MNNDQLLSHLGECLMEGSPAADDDPRAWAGLERALAEVPIAAVQSPLDRRATTRERLRRPVAATVVAAIVLSGGAAAAVGTNTLPDPLRSLASSLGLPVSLSALARAQDAMTALSEALQSRDPGAVRAALTALRADIAILDGADQGQLGPDAASLIAQAEIFLAGEPSGGRAGASRNDAESGFGDTGGPSRSSPGGASGSGIADTSDTEGSEAGGTADRQSPEGGEPEGFEAPEVSGGAGSVSSGPAPAASGSSDDGGGSTSISDGGSSGSTSDGGGGITSSSSDGGSGTSSGSISSSTTSDGSGSSGGGSDGGSSGSDGGGSTTLSGSPGSSLIN